MAMLFLNDVPIEELGIKLLESPTGWLDLAPYDYALQSVVGRPGQVAVGSALTIGSRPLAIPYLLSPTTLAGRRAAAAALYALAQGEVEVRFGDDPERVYYCLVQSGSASGYPPTWVEPGVSGVLRLIAVDPYAYHRAANSQVLPASTRVPLLRGTAPWRGIIVINGGGAGAGLLGTVLRHQSGDEIARMEFSNPTNLVLATADSLEIDCRNFASRQWVAATDSWTDVTAALAIGQDFMSFDPLDVPTLELLNGYDGHVRGRLADLA